MQRGSGYYPRDLSTSGRWSIQGQPGGSQAVRSEVFKLSTIEGNASTPPAKCERPF